MGQRWVGSVGRARKTTAPRAQLAAGAVVQSLFSRRAHQRDRRAMASKLWQLRVVPKPQRQHVAGASEDDGLPPAILKRLLGDDEMARRDLVPGPGQAGRNRQLVLFFAERGLRFDRERCDELAVQALPDVRHKAAAVAVKPADRQLLGQGGQVFGDRFIDLEVHKPGGLGNQLGIGGRELSPLGFVVLVVAEDDERGGEDSLAAVLALVVVLVMTGLLKRRRGPEGPFAVKWTRFGSRPAVLRADTWVS